MTDLVNGTRPTKPGTITKGAHIPLRQGDTQPVKKTGKASLHPKQAHLNSLIHAGIVTHLVHVDEGPDPLFAVAQMRDFAEIGFAAVFQDGLIALGCTGALPAALASIAVPAVATAPSRPEVAKGLARFESVSRRLETLVDQMEPEEAVLSEKLGTSILQRLTALETRIAAAPQKEVDPALTALSEKVDAVAQALTSRTDPAATLAELDGKLSRIAARPDPVVDMSAHKQTIDQFATVVTMVVKRIEAAAAEMKETVEETRATSNARDVPETARRFDDLTAQLDRLEKQLADRPAATSVVGPEIEDSLRKLIDKVRTPQNASPPHDDVIERLDQLGAAQRTAFTRIEAAMSKAVSGLAPALDHLNARAADTENMISDWHKDLKTLTSHTRAIADTTGQLPDAFDLLQKDITVLTNRPAPVLDLTAQKEGFAAFADELRHSLEKVETFAARVAEKSTLAAAQSDETLAALQTLPNLISAALRHDVDLTPIRDGIHDLQTQMGALPGDMNLSAITQGVTALFDQLVPMAELQTADIKALSSSVGSALTGLATLSEDIIRLDAKDPGLTPLHDLLTALEQQLSEATHQHDGQISQIKDTLTDLARHLGLTPHQMAQLTAPSILAPDTSLNTLRMEFADLISKRVKENRPIAPDTQRQA